MFAFAILISAMLADPCAFAPPITKQQEALIIKLGDPSWRVREQATKDLAALEFDGLRAYYLASINGDAEIAMRGQDLLSRFYFVGNSKRDTPGIHGLFEMKSFKLKSGREFVIGDSMAKDYYTHEVNRCVAYAKQYGKPFDPAILEWDASNYCTRAATGRLVQRLRNFGYDRKEVTEILDKMTEASAGADIGQEGWKKFRRMQGLDEFEYYGLFFGGNVFRCFIK